MASSFFNNISSRFGRGGAAPRGTSPYGAASSNLAPPSIPPMPQSPSLTAQLPAESVPNDSSSSRSRKPPFFFREENCGLIVKGNFMTLAAKPEHVDKGEWLAHQVVEQYRLLEGMIKVIQEVDQNTKQPICNPHTCPTMSAAEYTYTWLDNNRNPIRIPASHYITLVQRWILGKIQDPNIFPTAEPTAASIALTSAAMDAQQQGRSQAASPSVLAGERVWLGKPSGFPESFESDIKSLYRQMFRCYAHIYHGHWLEPFYHVGAYKELNTCFVHFINVGRLFDLINEKDLRPMQPLIDIWVNKGLLPSANGVVTSPQTIASPASGSAGASSQPVPAPA